MKDGVNLAPTKGTVSKPYIDMRPIDGFAAAQAYHRAYETMIADALGDLAVRALNAAGHHRRIRC